MDSSLKFQASDFSGQDIASLSDTPNSSGMTAAELKARFDNIGKVKIALGKHNDLVDALTAQTGAAGIGAVDGDGDATTAQALLTALVADDESNIIRIEELENTAIQMQPYLATGTDLNDVKTNGLYPGHGAYTYYNYPDGYPSNRSFILCVAKVASSGNVRQEFCDWLNGRKWVRSFGAAWTAWKALPWGNQTPNTVIVADADGFISSSGVSSTKLGYINGLTSDAQTQINEKVNTSDLTAANVPVEEVDYEIDKNPGFLHTVNKLFDSNVETALNWLSGQASDALRATVNNLGVKDADGTTFYITGQGAPHALLQSVVNAIVNRIDAARKEIYAVYPSDAASGTVASFPDGANGIPMESVLLQENNTLSVVYHADINLYIRKIT